VISEYSRLKDYVKYSLEGFFQALCIIRTPVDIQIAPDKSVLARGRLRKTDQRASQCFTGDSHPLCLKYST
jgi:hypothetical protein